LNYTFFFIQQHALQHKKLNETAIERKDCNTSWHKANVCIHSVANIVGFWNS